MRRILAFLFALCLVISTGCGKQSKKVNPYSSSIETVSEETESAKPAKAKYDVYGGEDVFASFLEEEEETTTTVLVEKGTSVPTLETKWDTVNFAPTKGECETTAANMRNKILNTGNTSEYCTWSGKTYYVSPDGNDDNDGLSEKTAVQSMDADAFVVNPPQPGDAVLFERGGLWRLTGAIKTREGVTYGSYGKGEKPTFYGSPANYADEKYWIASKKANIWKFTIPADDVGLILFNHGELVGYKRFNGITVLEHNGDFYYNINDDTVYLYCDKGNPGKVYYDIEVGCKYEAFGVNRDNVVIDNFKIKYFGHGGIYAAGQNNNLTVTNCELGFIGGVLHHDQVRMGNAVQQWNSTDKQLVENNWIYQVYDTGYTYQGNDEYNPGQDAEGNLLVDERTFYKNITVKNNLIEYCNYALELWHTSQSGEPTPVQIENLYVSGNLLRFNGYGWGGIQRTDFTGHAIYFGKHNFKNAKNCVITDNILDLSSRALTYWVFGGARLGEWNITGNTFYQTKNTKDEGIWVGSLRGATDQATLESAVTIFDTAPKYVKWVTK